VDESQRILAVALDSETLERIGPVLRRSSLSVHTAAQAQDAAVLAAGERFHLVICRYPLPDLKLREFVTAIRTTESASKEASLLLLTIPEMMTEARGGVESGAFLVFSGQENPGTIGRGAAHLLQVAPRFSPRTTARVRVRFDGDENFRGWVVNLSVTGMLVTNCPMMPVGRRCSFDFSLPNGETVRGTGVVARHAAPRREKVTGFAIRFTTLEESCRESLENWCRSGAHE